MVGFQPIEEGIAVAGPRALQRPACRFQLNRRWCACVTMKKSYPCFEGAAERRALSSVPS